MATAPPNTAVQWATDSATPAAEYPDSYWRSLFYFNVYRLIVALLLLGIVAIWGNSLTFGSRDLTVFVVAAGGYALFSIGCFVLTKIRWQFNLQLTVQVAADVAFIVTLIYASNGISSGLGLLLLAVLAGAGLISRGRLTLFHAALASIGVLLEHTYDVLYFEASEAQFVQAGLLSISYFATAWLAHTLAKYTLASEQLAAQREIDLANMAQVNQLVIQDMQDGVLVVDSGGMIRQINARAERMLGTLPERHDARLNRYNPALATRFDAWRGGEEDAGTAGESFVGGMVGARFVPIGASRELGAVIFLEDMSRVQAQARQLKLAALGRLTANIAHEIRNPLGAISHAAQLLQEEPALHDTTGRLLTIIYDNSQRLDRMVNDVLRLNRSDRTSREPFPLVAFLRNFVEQFCQIERIRPEVIAIELAAEPEAEFDLAHFDQVMWNLCRNALRHCRKAQASIRICVGRDVRVGAVRLDVIDDGPGVPLEARGKLFEPFFTDAPGGTGLGLYIAREMCEANGATLDYVATPSGAQFTILCRGS
ncbi:MAG: ATP-binding protein [Betaproteobacteria bacterium]|nr:ATP-binding protein [Betaproteobacteria bacterium]